MKELHQLMEYINYYHYSEDEEKIVIVHSPYDTLYGKIKALLY